MSAVWTKSRRAAENAFPAAFVALDSQCDDLFAYTDVLYRTEKRKGKPHRLTMHVNHSGSDRPRLRLRWHAAAEVWVRYSCAFATKRVYSRLSISCDMLVRPSRWSSNRPRSRAGSG